MKGIKSLLVGEDGVGKTCMLVSYTCGALPVEELPPVFQPSRANVVVDGKPYQLTLQECFSTLQLHLTDVLLLCFSVSSSHSFQQIKDKWDPEVSRYFPGVPKLLVGTKVDLRNENSNNELVSETQGHSMGEEIGAVGYYECSGLTQQGLKQVFEEAIRAVDKPETPQHKQQKQKNSRCGIC
eukprot:CAMPEP_0174258422 /NCGR_PEP_ID=MMETSP0439-20130205/7416_1 /TAXON_ID=0 /ORGANISM="Stereomyxa ramosa, Strain Chinc5" /LENGTH=181 /DNA_ID=CAMNT_0015341923 /DNA_START=44 /DNA_END=589 /DNA_ORIENTATION=-